MTDEPKLQLTLKGGDSSLFLSDARSGLIARGRRDASMLPRPTEPIDPLSETRRLAEEGNADAQYKLGEAYGEGEGVEQDWAEAARWYRQAAEQGNAEAMFKLGRLYRWGCGVTHDESEWARWFLEAEETGYESRELGEWLGLFYNDGLWVGRDYVRARKWFLKGLPSEVGSSEYFLGYYFFCGLGVQRDYAKAAAWLLEAVHADLAYYDESCFLLGRIYSLDVVVKQWRDSARIDEALKWDREHAARTPEEVQQTDRDFWNKVGGLSDVDCEQEARATLPVGYAQFRLGLAYAYGRGVTRDDAEAIRLWHKAADGDHPAVWAQLHLALAYNKGRGVPEDFVQAHLWFNLALSGVEGGKFSPYVSGRWSDGITIDGIQAYVAAARDEVAGKMTPQQIVEAQQLEREWKVALAK